MRVFYRVSALVSLWLTPLPRFLQSGAPSAPMSSREQKQAASVAIGETLDRLMDRYADGDDQAFVELYAGLAPRVKTFLLRMGANLALADDLTQEAFLRMHRARGHFQKGAHVVPWVYAIARSAFLDSARKRKNDRIAPTANDEEGDARREGAEPAKAEGAAIARQALERLRRAMMDLPEAQREAFVLVRFEGLSVEEAARVVGTTPGALKIRAFRAHDTLRGILDDQGER